MIFAHITTFTKSECPLYLLLTVLLSLSQLQTSLSQHPAKTKAPPWPPIATDVKGAVGPLYIALVFLVYTPVRVLPGAQNILSVPTSILTRRMHPALSATYTELGENGSATMFRIFEESTIGSPFLFPDLAALRPRVNSEASVWKKWPGSADRDIFRHSEPQMFP